MLALSQLCSGEQTLGFAVAYIKLASIRIWPRAYESMP